jgi:hypothetical protein
MPKLPPGPNANIRIAMLGMIPGNGHPYSWSAIVNGFDTAAMAKCPYPVICQYLGAQPTGSVRIPGVQVTHLWTDNPAEAPQVAAAALIPNVVAKPEDVIGHVDAVMIATDDGFDHVRRARPFVEAGLPVFVDKPLALTLEDLRTFIAWQKAGAPLLSSSGLRYSPELASYRAGTTHPTVGNLRWMSCATGKTWERYGIHVLEAMARVLGPGFISIRLESAPGLEIAHVTHRSGVQLTLPIIEDGGAAFGLVQICGTAGAVSVKLADTYTAFRGQMLNFIEFVRTGQASYAFTETIELMSVLIAGIRSRTEGSRRVEINEIISAL